MLKQNQQQKMIFSRQNARITCENTSHFKVLGRYANKRNAASNRLLSQYPNPKKRQEQKAQSQINCQPSPLTFSQRKLSLVLSSGTA